MSIEGMLSPLRAAVAAESITVPIEKGSLVIAPTSILRTKISDVDHFFEYVAILQTTVIDKLTEKGGDFVMQVWNPSSPLSSDKFCKIRMNTTIVSSIDRIEGKTVLTRDLYQKCKGCDLMELLTPLSATHDGKVFRPVVGKMAGRKFAVIAFMDTDINIHHSSKPKRVISNIISDNPLAESCQPSLPKLAKTEYYGLDKFTNTVLINWYIDSLLSSANMNSIRKLYYPFRCGNDGYMLVESGNYSTVMNHEITHRCQVWSFMFQLFSLLHKLADYDLSFQDISERTIIVEDVPCNYEYDDVVVTGSTSLKLNELANAGINIKKEDESIRIYRDRGVIDDFVARVTHKVISWGRHHSLAKIPGQQPISWVTYKIAPPVKRVHDYGLLLDDITEREENADTEAFIHVHRLGIPMYRGSFDAYRLVLMMCENKGLYHALMNDPELNVLWRSFWTPIEYEVINARIRSRKSESYPYTKMLLGLNLRCDLVNFIWKQLKHYSHSKHTSSSKCNDTPDTIIQSPP